MNQGGHSTRRKRMVVNMASAIALMAAMSVQADDSKFDLNIKGQTAGSALVELGETSGVQIIFPGGTGNGVQLNAVNGNYTVAEALTMMLEGSGLTFEFTSESTVVVSEKSSDASSEEEPDEELVITGTRLKNGVQTGSNVISLTRDDIERRGFGSVEDVIRSLPQNFSNVNAATTLDNSLSATGDQGQSAANLRGLGSGNTLILVNGRRWAGSVTFGDGTVNLNGIPFNAIKQVNILLDGASAVYGADAQGGVIDFILVDDYVGAEVSARYDMGRNEGDENEISALFGFGWGSGNMNASISAKSTDPVDRFKAGGTTFDLSPLGGTDNRISSTFAAGQPGRVFDGFAFLGTLPAGDDGTNGLTGLDPANLTPFDLGAVPVGGSTTESDDLSVFVRAEQELFDGFQVFGELSYSDNESETAPGIPTLSAFPSFGSDLGVVPTTNPYNDTGNELGVYYSFAAEAVAGLLDGVISPTVSERENTTLVLGFDAQLSDDWDMNFSASRAEEEALFLFSLGFDDDLLAQRLAGVDANGNPLPIEQVINPFGDGSANTAAAFEGLGGGNGVVGPLGTVLPDSVPSVSEQDSYLLTVTGNLLELPAGDLGVVFGAEYRTETFNNAPGTTLTIVEDPERDVTSFFAEVGIPLVGDNNRVPGIHALDLTLAARHDDYSLEGPFDSANPNAIESRSFSSTSPKVDLAWYPIEELKIRASWGESFKAPSLRSIFDDQLLLQFLLITDPNNPSAGPQEPILVFGGNPDLGPELSDNKSFGFDWTPSGALQGLTVSATIAEIDITDRIDGLFSVASRTPNLLFDVPGAVEFDPTTGLISRINVNDINVANELSEFADFNISYDFDTDFGAFTAALGGTYTSLKRQQLTPGSAPDANDGRQDGPERLKAVGSLGWAGENLSANWFVNYSSSYTQQESFGTTFSNPLRIHHYVTHDLTMSYDMDEYDVTIKGGVRNVFNRSFPFFDGFGVPWDPRRVDVRGRIITFDVTKRFDI
ncbi:TonB-dependent receptor [Porticoccus sp. W117]|uniref:TonB-dependent receptor n=1 Tax=Porticoccus sp. W117 TaxID=3054777 RepID=UPI0025963CF7|nr:TonB-dependent receptor [Porticoccus sp. W117]MDM3871433.1 TonB-dependent receptor [Porticoccus sp. W117]